MMVIIMEYANAGNLRQEIERYPAKRMPVTGVRYYMIQILHGLEYMHGKGVIHNDLNVNNIFLSYNGDGRTKTCKIGDFGLAEIASPNEIPEVDMEQVGSLLGDMLSGMDYTLLTTLHTPERKISEDCFNFESAKDLLAHEWFKKTAVAPVPPVRHDHQPSGAHGFTPEAGPSRQLSPPPVSLPKKREWRFARPTRLFRQTPIDPIKVKPVVIDPLVPSLSNSPSPSSPTLSGSRPASPTRSSPAPSVSYSASSARSSPSRHSRRHSSRCEEEIEVVPPEPVVHIEPAAAAPLPLSWRRRVGRSLSSMGQAVRHGIGCLNCLHGYRRHENPAEPIPPPDSESRTRWYV